jgi:hypothetical protein
MAPPRTWNRRFTTEQGEQEGRAGTTSQAPPPPIHPRAAVARQLGGGQEWQQAGDPVDEHRHPPVRTMFDRAARPIITPHARLPYSMPRVVWIYTTRTVRHALDLRYHSRWPCAVDLVFALPQANTAAAPDGDYEQEHEDVGSRLHHCQVSVVNNWHSSVRIVCTMVPLRLWTTCTAAPCKRQPLNFVGILSRGAPQVEESPQSGLHKLPVCGCLRQSPAPSTALSYTRSVSMWVKEYDNCVLFY